MKIDLHVIVSGLLLSGSLSLAVYGQSSPAAGTTDGIAQPSQTLPSSQTKPNSQPAQTSSVKIDEDSSYATGKPLAGQSKEGFWGKINPFARKKWVKRQVDPIRDRTNELDQLQSKNANDIRDVDARSQAGVNKAITAANSADQRAVAAHGVADSAQRVADDASGRTKALSGTVNNIDQYRTVTSLSVVFAQGRTVLGPKGKAQLDEITSKLANEKGYILEVQGYSRNGVQNSQAMADSVVRYLVTEHQVPLYRIYKTGLGKNKQPDTSGEKPLTNGVTVSLMQNSLANMEPASAFSSPVTRPRESERITAARTGVSNPDAN